MRDNIADAVAHGAQTHRLAGRLNQDPNSSAAEAATAIGEALETTAKR